jgi:hypothetical protein
MCILSLPVQLLKPESKLGNISPKCTVFHHFFLTPPDNLLAYCLSLSSTAPLGVWGLHDFTRNLKLETKMSNVQHQETIKEILKVASETLNKRSLLLTRLKLATSG